MKEINENEFEDSIISNENVIIDFSASWCGPCKTLQPILEQVANENENISIFKIDVDKEIELCEKYAIRSVPTMLFFKNGKETHRTIGTQNKGNILVLCGLEK